jgi:hypothetical protein
MGHDIDIDISDLSSAPLPADIHFPKKGVMAGVQCDGARLRIPLGIYYCVSIRRDIEEKLATHQLRPQWHLVSKGVDLAGAPIRYVAVSPNVDDGWS